MNRKDTTPSDFPRPHGVKMAEEAREMVAWLASNPAERVPGVEVVLPRIGLLRGPAHLCPTHGLREEIGRCQRNGELARAATLREELARRGVTA